jgi:hypothetical protein
MGYQPRIKAPRDAVHGFRKPLREKGKNRKRIHRSVGRQVEEEKQPATEREISEATLRRLHTLGSQKFGSFPFSDHFSRWLANVEAVLSEFISNPNIGIDEQFSAGYQQTLAAIKQQLEDRSRKENAIEKEIKNLSCCKKLLEHINTEWATTANTLATKKKSEIKRLNQEIEGLKKEQEKVIRMKTGFFRGISKKEREQKEIAIAQRLNDKQTEVELAVLNFKAEQKMLREKYETKREPLLEELKRFKKNIRELETDGSLEERWFACEALTDAVNSFLQRKAAGSANAKGLEPQNGGA